MEALAIGTKIVKCNSEEGDGHVDGAIGVVVGCLELPEGLIVGNEVTKDEFMYTVEWVDYPGLPVWIVGSRISG
mgnify:FL=1